MIFAFGRGHCQVILTKHAMLGECGAALAWASAQGARTEQNITELRILTCGSSPGYDFSSWWRF